MPRMYRITIVASMLLVLYALAVSAQTPLWSQRFGGTDADEGYDLAIDPSNNVLITGSFTGAADFGVLLK